MKSTKQFQAGERGRVLLNALVLIGLGLITFGLYAPVLTFTFMYDDAVDLPRGLGFSAWELLTSSHTYSYYRPLPFLIWKGMVAWQQGHFPPFWFHLLPLLLHWLNSYLVFLLAYHCYRTAASRWAPTLTGPRPANQGIGEMANIVLNLLSSPPSAALIAAVLFIYYPFSYQVVPWAGALFHPLVTCCVLITLLFYWQARQTRNRWYHLPALLTLILGFLTHENGVVALPLLLLLEGWWRLCRCGPGEIEFRRERDGRHALQHQQPARVIKGKRGAFAAGLRAPLRSLFPYLVLGCLYVYFWMRIPKQSAGSAHFDLLTLKLNALFFLQGLLYPVVAPISRWIASREPSWVANGAFTQQGVRLAVAWMAAIGVLAVLYWCGRRLSLFFLLLAGVVSAAAPAVLSLPFDYIIDGSRLLYFPAVGVCILWAALWTLDKTNGHHPLWLVWRTLWRGALTCGLVALLSQNMAFLKVRMEMYAVGSAIVREVTASTALLPAGGRNQTVLYDNVPSWMAQLPPEYPLGHTGITMIPDYVALPVLSYMQGYPTAAQMNTVTFPGIRPRFHFNYGTLGGTPPLAELAHTLRGVTRVYVAEPEPQRFHLIEVGTVQGDSAPQTSQTLALFAGRYALAKSQARRQPGGVQVALTWQALTSPAARAPDATIFVHLSNSQGKVISQIDGYPIHGMSALRYWQVGDLITDLRTIPVPTGLAHGAYTITVGVYDTGTHKRFPAQRENGQAWPADEVLVETVIL